MTNPAFNFVISLMLGGLVALAAPWLIFWHGTTQFGIHPATAVGLAAAAIYAMMAVSLALASLADSLPNPMPMGPSFMMGAGILLAGFLLVPVLVLPGLVWLYVLPFDARGRFDVTAILSLDASDVSFPNHASEERDGGEGGTGVNP